MDYHKLLDACDNWLKYAIYLHLLHDPKDSLGEIRKMALADDRIQHFLTFSICTKQYSSAFFV